MVTLGPISAAAFPSVLFSTHQLIEIASNSIENKENPQKCEEYLFKARNRAVLGKSARRAPRGRGHGQRPDAPPPLGHRRRRRTRPQEVPRRPLRLHRFVLGNFAEFPGVRYIK